MAKNNKKCNFEKLLDESLEKYYWLGFLLADASFKKTKEIIIAISEKDKQHLLKLKDFLKIENMHYNKKTKSFKIGGRDSLIFDTITKLYNIKSNKTYFPPELGSIVEYNKIFSLIIGFIDGDGCIKHLKNRPDCNLAIKCHSSWLETLKFFLELLYKDCEFKMPGVKNNNAGYANFTISNSVVLKKIKNKAIELNIPLLKRKWDKIDLSYIGRNERAQKNKIEIIRLLEEGKRNKYICQELSIKPSALSSFIKLNNLKSE